MSPSSSGSGGEFLAKKSDVTRLRKALPELRDILIVEDEAMDADRLKATLRVMFGYDLIVRRAATLAKALDAIIEKKPDLVFLDDMLKPSDTALVSIPYLRRADYAGAIVVVSGQVTKSRRNELLSVGATDVIHKDDVDSVRLAEALLRVFGTPVAEPVLDAKSASKKTRR